MAYDLAKVTANGNNLIAQILANKSSLSIDKIEISDTQLPSTTDISTMTSVPKVVQTVSANGFSKNSNTLIISTVVDNSSIRADYKAWVFGIWGSDSQNGQSQLIAVITSTNSPDTIPAFSGRTPVSYTYKFNIGFSNASQIQFNMIDDSFATNDTVVHTTGDETIDGQKKFETDPTDGAGNAYAKTVDVNQQLDKKVVDNKDGTEQLNGVQVQPFNKLSDTIGGRNYLINTQNPSATNPVRFANVPAPLISGTVTFSNGYIKLSSPLSSNGVETFYRFTDPSYTSMPLPAGTYTLVVDLESNDNVQVIPRGEFSTDGNTFQPLSWPIWKPSSTEQQFSYTFTIPSNATGWYISLEMFTDDGARDNTGKCFQFKNVSIQKGNIATDSSPAPEDKVNVTDMRKPASDVAGIDEVNTKQDKIGYTPADDSTVLHNNALNQILTDNSGIIIGNDKDFGFIKRENYKGGLAIGSGNSFHFLATNDTALSNTSEYHDVWNILPNGQVSIRDGAYFTPADDSKVAHLSGANNFDTVPTVNNNPLLLASSLPSDLARTGSDQEFTGKNTFDTAPIDKTTGNPYITKDGVPSDVARTGQAQTFTAAQTFSIAPVINDASKDKGDNQAATMADLKSVEESAWRQLDSSLITVDIGTIPYTNCLYKIDPVNKKIYIQWMMQINYETYYGNAYLDFSSVVSKFTSKGSGHMLYEDANHDTLGTSVFRISGSKISVDVSKTSDIIVSGYLEDCWFGYDTLLI